MTWLDFIDAHFNGIAVLIVLLAVVGMITVVGAISEWRRK